LIGNSGFNYKRDVKKWTKKLSDLIEESEPNLAERKAGLKTLWLPVWNDLLFMERKDKLTAACLKRL